MELIIERVWEAAGEGGGAEAGQAENRTLHRGLESVFVCGLGLLLLVLHMCHVRYSRCDSGAGCKVMAHRHAVNIQGLSRLVAVAAAAAAMANAFYSVRC